MAENSFTLGELEKVSLVGSNASQANLTLSSTSFSQQLTTGTPTPSLSSATTAATDAASSSLSGALESAKSIVTTALFGDIDEVTITSSYYNLDTPYTGYVWISFPPPINTATVDQNSILGSLNVAANTLNKITDLITVRPQQLREFSFSRFINGVGQFKLTLFDPNFTEIETKLVQNKGTIAFKYGYSDKYSTTEISTSQLNQGVSPLYTGKVLNYSIEFFLGGAEITMTGLSAGFELNTIRTFSAHKSLDGYKISTIVETLAAEAGLTPKVEPTARVLTRSGSDTVDKLDKIFMQTGETSLQFIISKLIPYAVNEKGDSNYSVFVKLGTKNPELHFHTPYWKDPDKSKSPTASTSLTGAAASATGSKAVSQSEVVPTFTMFKNKNSVLRSFKPNWNMSTFQIVGGGSTYSAAINSTSKDIRQILVNNNTVVPQTVDGKDNKGINIEPKQEGKKVSTFNSLVMPGPSKEEQDARTLSALSTRHIGAISATAEIMGNATSFNIFDKVAVIIYIPVGDDISSLVNKNVHWVSGYYRISGITDIIRGGDFITHLQLMTDGRSNFVQDSKVVRTSS